MRADSVRTTRPVTRPRDTVHRDVSRSAISLHSARPVSSGYILCQCIPTFQKVESILLWNAFIFACLLAWKWIISLASSGMLCCCSLIGVLSNLDQYFWIWDHFWIVVCGNEEQHAVLYPSPATLADWCAEFLENLYEKDKVYMTHLLARRALLQRNFNLLNPLCGEGHRSPERKRSDGL